MNTKPQILTFLKSLVLVLIILVMTCHALVAENIVPNGNFEVPDASGANPKNWVNMNGTYKTDGKNHWMLFKDSESAEIKIPLKPEWKFLRIKARMKASGLVPGKESWNNGRVIVSFLENEEGKNIYAPCPELKKDSSWVNLESLVPVPAGMKFIRLQPGIFKAKGIVEIDDVQVEPVSPLEALQKNAKLPPGMKTSWGSEPVVDLNDKRSEIVLNGLWSFMPATGSGKFPPKKGWGYSWVPGSWNQKWNYPRIVKHPAWKNKINLRTLAKAWYEREFRVPEAWKGRTTLLDFQRVSTDASVYVNGKFCGEIKWPFGEIDITAAVKFGENNLLQVLVVSAQDAKEVMVFMGPNQISKTKASLATRGIIGDVTLESRPQGAYVKDVFIKTSVSEKTLGIDVELEGCKKGPVTFTAKIYHKGEEVKQFTSEMEVTPEMKTVKLEWAWADPKLWDVEQPNLYTLQLEVKGLGIDDVYKQRFGFREFKIKGRKFYLNGVEFKIRPNSHMGYFSNNEIVAEGIMRGYLEVGCNTVEFWPQNHDERGSDGAAARELWVRKADEIGFPIIANAMSMSHLVGKSWSSPEIKAAWKKRMETEARRYRNHPSVIMWVHSSNRFGHPDDQNPLRIGVKSWETLSEDWKKKARQGEEASAMIKAFDPTRPVMSHECGPVGDVYTLNNYLCLIPLQEREEWLEQWSKNGDMPYMAVEFGTPLDSTFSRGRRGGNKAGADETFYTEMAAIYLGEEAYSMESEQFRKNLRNLELALVERRSKGNKPAWHWNWRQMTKNGEDIDSFQEIQKLFITNTWRSWRAMGITGGMVPWCMIKYGWRYYPYDGKVARDKLYLWDIPFVPGSRGVYHSYLRKIESSFMNPASYERVLKAGRAIQAVNQKTLAMIGGAPPKWVAKNHHFFSGQSIDKQVILINDSRKSKNYSFVVNLTINGETVGKKTGEGVLEAAETKFLSVSFNPPAVTEKTSGELLLNAQIGDQKHQQRFPIRIYPAIKEKSTKSILVFDPEGETLKVLSKLGFKTQIWIGQTENSGETLVVGRGALERKLPGDLATFVKNGGRVVIQSQNPDFLRDTLGLRVSHHVSRRAWPVATQTKHPVVKDLDGEDFRDWNGSGTLVKPYPTELKTPSLSAQAVKGRGWHQGNRGSVSSAMIEKPHYSGWTPILEGEFDLAFSPLMELRLGKGMVVLNTLDIEGRASDEPMAEIIMKRILDYAGSAEIRSADVNVILDGSEKDVRLLRNTGVKFSRGETSNPKDIVITTRNGKLDADAIEKIVSKGGKVILLGIPKELPFELKSTVRNGRYIKLEPNKAAAGLSSSDLHLRYDVPYSAMSGSGVKSFGDGLVTLFEHDSGGKIWGIAVPPDTLPIKDQSFLLYSNWRATRAFSQILANEGVASLADGKLLSGSSRGLEPISLAGPAEMFIEQQVAPGVAMKASTPMKLQDVKEGDAWMKTTLPGAWEKGASSNFDGAVWFRKSIILPENMRDKQLKLKLGPLDDFDVTYVNGVEVGRTGAETPKFYAHPRNYPVPAKLTTNGKLTIAVRVWDHFGGGGFGASDPQKMCLESEDGSIFPLAGKWKYRVELSLKPAKTFKNPHLDPGIKPEASLWKDLACDDKAWKEIDLPNLFEQGISLFDGVVWYRLKVKVPKSCEGYDMALDLSSIADEDIVYFNGEQIGASKGRGIFRQYTVPAKIIKFNEENEIYVRVVNHQDEGGFLAQPSELNMIVPEAPESAKWYVPGYSEEFWRGDDYTRYFRW